MCNRLKIMIMSAVSSLIILSNVVFSSLCASAAAPAVALTPELVAELLVALGLIASNGSGGYTWVGDDTYTKSIFEVQVGSKINNGILIADDFAPTFGTIIPDDVYSVVTTDSGTHNFLVGGKTVTTSDLFVMAKSLASTNYKVPVNIKGASFCSVTTDNEGSRYFYSSFSQSYIPSKSGLYAFYVDTSGKQYMSDDYFCFTGEYDVEGRALVNCGFWSQRPKLTNSNYPIPFSSPKYLAFHHLF